MLVCLSWSLVWAPVANAQAGIAAGRLSVAISEITIAKAARWGFAANDPRVTATRAGISGGLTVLAVGAGAVSWPALLVAAGVGALVVGGIALAKDKGYTWSFGANGAVTSGGTAPGSYQYGAATAPMTLGGVAYRGSINVTNTDGSVVTGFLYASDPASLAVSMALAFYGSGISADSCGAVGGGQWMCRVLRYGDTYWNAYFYQVTATSDIVSGQNSSGTFDPRPPPPSTAITPVVYTKPDDAVKALPASVLSQQMSPELMAAAVNTAWKGAIGASTSGGIPWSASDPVTPSDVSAWFTANPNSVPSVGDFSSAATVTVGGQVTVPVGSTYSTGGGGSASLPSSGGSTSPSTGTGSGSTAPATTAPTTGADPTTDPLNLGPIPNIGAPTLEDTPDAAKILDPAFSLMPDLKNFAVPSHTGVCPTAAFSLYGKSYVMDAHCNLLEQNRTLIGALMVLVFTLVATYTVLRA